MKEGEILKNHSLGAMLKFSDRLLEKSVNNKMSNFNITRSQMELLAYVFIQNQEGNEVNQVDIEKYLNLRNPTVTGLINRLEKKEYIKRGVSNKGANYKSIIITEKGIKLLEDGKKIIDNVEKSMFSVLSKEEKDELAKILTKVIDNKISND